MCNTYQVSKHASDGTRSTGDSCCFAAWPPAERRREKERVHLKPKHGAAVRLIMLCSNHRGQMVAVFLVKDPCSIS